MRNTRPEGKAGSFLGFRMEIRRASFHAVGKYWVVWIALKIVTRREIARSGRCFRALFGMPSEPGALP